MNIQVISFRCNLRDRFGCLISSSVNRDVLTSLPDVEVPLRGLAKGLQGLTKGETRKISLTAEEAYGFYDPKKVILFPRKKIPGAGDLRTGQTLVLVLRSGQSRSYRVLQVLAETVQLDGNHPLAGQDLSFEIEAFEVRDATDEEIQEAQNPVAVQLLH